MPEILIYLKKLHGFTGKKLYWNILVMSIISMIEGFSIFLLVPLLSLSGVFALNIGNVPLMSTFLKLLARIPDHLIFPTLLIFYALLIVSQAYLFRRHSNLSSQINQGFIQYLRMDIYQGLMMANWPFFLRKRKSDFNHSLTSELTRVIQGTLQTLVLLTTMLFTVIQIGFALWLSVKLTCFVLISGAVFMLFSRKFIRQSKVIGDRTSEISQKYMAAVTEHFNGIKDIKSNRLEQSHTNWFRSICRSLEQNAIEFMNLQSKTQFIYKSSSAILIVLFIFVSVMIFHIQPEQLILVILIFSRLWPRFTMILTSIEQVVTNIPAFKNLLSLQQECEAAKEPDQTPANNEKSLRIKQGIECRHVHYRYDRSHDIYALRDISLFIPANSTTAIVGKSGAGKSTLVDTIIGLIQPEKGEVLIDGEPLSDKNLYSYRNSVSYVSQDPVLFNASIRENLLLLEPSADENQLWDALQQSAADEFVRHLPQGMDTVIGDRGVRLSGGERQRIVLARALLRKPSILVLDEATSALDNENEAKIQSALDRLKGNLTIIIIAHRLSTIRNADQVIVLEHGAIVQQGEYHQLSKESRGTFSKLLAYQTEASR